LFYESQESGLLDFSAQKTLSKLESDTRACSFLAQASPALRAFDGEAGQASKNLLLKKV
jgi:hypothetical protein